MSLKDIPKIELHLHLEGAAPSSFIKGLAAKKSVDISKIFAPDGGYAYKDFTHFLSVYEAATSVLTTPEDFYQMTKAVLEETASHGVVYAETFVSPDFCGGGDVAAWRDYMAAMELASAEAEAAYGITLRGIVTCIRHFGPEKAKAAALCAAETQGEWMRGFGMAGAEDMGRQSDYAYSFDLAREAGLHLTTHAGEWRGPSEVRDALDLGVSRIGHGVRAIEDAATVQMLVDQQVVLEVCPGSNVTLGVVPNWQSHPIQKLRDAGVRVTVSTDDPPFFHTTMTREFEMLAETFGWDDADFSQINHTALDAAFCTDETRQKIAKRLES